MKSYSMYLVMHCQYSYNNNNNNNSVGLLTGPRPGEGNRSKTLIHFGLKYRSIINFYFEFLWRPTHGKTMANLIINWKGIEIIQKSIIKVGTWPTNPTLLYSEERKSPNELFEFWPNGKFSKSCFVFWRVI